MKKLFHFTAMVLLFGGCAKDPEGPRSLWKTLPSGTTRTITDVHIFNEQFGVACGEFGTMLKTEDGGSSWQALDVGVNHSFLATFALSDESFFTSRVGLFKTEDSGTSFNELGETSTFGSSITGIHFQSDAQGLICKGSAMYKTEDGGATWQVVYSELGYASLLIQATDDTYYLAGGRTYDMVSEGTLHRSTDGGETWSEIDLPSDLAGSEITAADFLDEYTGYVATFDRRVFRTTNGCETWDEVAQLSGDVITDMIFLNHGTGYLTSGQYIYCSRDAGVDWSISHSLPPERSFTALGYSPAGEVFAVGTDGTIVRKE